MRPSAGNACSTASANDSTAAALVRLISTTLSRSTSFSRVQVSVGASSLPCGRAGKCTAPPPEENAHDVICGWMRNIGTVPSCTRYA